MKLHPVPVVHTILISKDQVVSVGFCDSSIEKGALRKTLRLARVILVAGHNWMRHYNIGTIVTDDNFICWFCLVFERVETEAKICWVVVVRNDDGCFHSLITVFAKR